MPPSGDSSEPTATLGPLLARLPTDRRLPPASSDPELLGELKPPDEPTAGDRGASPAWLAAVRGAQRRLPRLREGSVVYCSLRDRVVGLSAIDDHAPPERVRLYDGGHEFFASASRDRTVDRFAADCHAVADGRPPDPATR